MIATQINKCNIDFNIDYEKSNELQTLGLYLHSGASTGSCPSLVVAGTTAARESIGVGISAIVLYSSIIIVVPKSRPIVVAQGVTIIPIIKS